MVITFSNDITRDCWYGLNNIILYWWCVYILKKELIKQLEDVELEQYIRWLSYNNKRTHILLEKDTQDIYEDTYSLENGKYI